MSSFQDIDISLCKNLIECNLDKKINICQKYVGNEQVCPSPPLHDILYSQLLTAFETLLPCPKAQLQNDSHALTIEKHCNSTSDEIKALEIAKNKVDLNINKYVSSNNDVLTKPDTELASKSSAPNTSVSLTKRLLHSLQYYLKTNL